MVHIDDDGGEEPLAPVIPLFGAGRSGNEPRATGGREGPEQTHATSSGPGQWHASWLDEGPDAGEAATAAAREGAERVLMRRLRARSLSEREARSLAADQGLDADDVEVLIGRLVRLGYLDDARLAEQLVHTAVERKGQGRAVIAQTLSQRGIERDVAREAMDALPDDEYERALEFARRKARTLSSLDRETALRRLHGQLARRGFGGASAGAAARAALDELAPGRSGVRFT